MRIALLGCSAEFGDLQPAELEIAVRVPAAGSPNSEMSGPGSGKRAAEIGQIAICKGGGACAQLARRRQSSPGLSLRAHYEEWRCLNS